VQFSLERDIVEVVELAEGCTSDIKYPRSARTSRIDMIAPNIATLTIHPELLVDAPPKAKGKYHSLMYL
jgi:hypothetical protein